MDLETENRIAAILLKEAAELRREAQKEGALAYLRQPTVRSRPNSRFLTATVRGVQQANRVVEVNEMWRLREKQLELDNRLRGGRNESSSERGSRDVSESRRSTSRGRNEMETSASTCLSSKKRSVRDFGRIEGEGLRDDEMDEFLYSRTKRGRGAVGSRMDETGPYLPCSPDSKRNVLESDYEEPKKARVLLGPLKPHSYQSSEESSDDDTFRDKKRKEKSKRHSKTHKSKEKRSKEKERNKKKRKEKKSKHHK